MWAFFLRSAALTLASALTLSALASDPALAAQRVALVIGNDAYANVTPLEKAVADARAYRDHFKQARAFDQVVYAENATVARMDAAIDRFLDAVQPGDIAVVVFSGHGVQLDPAREDTLFLLPTDAPALSPDTPSYDRALRRAAIQFSDLRARLAARRASLRLFILDACRDNPFETRPHPTRSGATRSVGMARGLAPVRQEAGEFVIYAAAPGARALDRLAPDDRARNSVFSRVFLEKFKPGVYLEDVAKDVQQAVFDLAQTARPRPFAQRPFYADGVLGRACLDAECGAQAVAALTPAPAPAGGREAQAKAALRAAPTPPAPAGFAARLKALPQGRPLKECEACPALVAIPGGRFTMGSPPDEADRGEGRAEAPSDHRRLCFGAGCGDGGRVPAFCAGDGAAHDAVLGAKILRLVEVRLGRERELGASWVFARGRSSCGVRVLGGCEGLCVLVERSGGRRALSSSV